MAKNFRDKFYSDVMVLILRILIVFSLFSCNKNTNIIYELKPDKKFNFIKKVNGDSIKIVAEPFLLDYSQSNYLKISRFHSNKSKYEIETILLKVNGEYYNYFNLEDQDSIDNESFVFLTKKEQKIEKTITPNPINYWKKQTEIFKKESDGNYSRQLFFTSPNNYILDFGKFFYDENYKIFKIEEVINNEKITYK